MSMRNTVPILGTLILLSSPALASTWYVNGASGDAGNTCKTAASACATIKRAISLAASGDTIEIAPATYQKNLAIPFNLTLNGTKAATTIIDGTSTANVLTVGAGISLTVTNLTIKNGVGYQGGGAIYNDGGAVQISNTTFGINADTYGGSNGTLTNAAGSIQIQNSIVANLGYGGNCGGTITSSGYNISSDGSCNFANTGDRNNTNPNLGTLRNKGGPTQTMALPKGSPALDAGNPAGCTDFSNNLLTTNQRGKPRPGGSETHGCDLGAYESQTY